jgi:hypothetical protein
MPNKERNSEDPTIRKKCPMTTLLELTNIQGNMVMLLPEFKYNSKDCPESSKTRPKSVSDWQQFCSTFHAYP